MDGLEDIIESGLNALKDLFGQSDDGGDLSADLSSIGDMPVDAILASDFESLTGLSINEFSDEFNAAMNDALSCFSDNPSIEGNLEINTGNDISFTGNYYDDQITSAQNDFDSQIEQAADSRTTDEMKYHIDKAENARQSKHFWEDCKTESGIEQRKIEIQRELAQKQLDIENKLQEDIENIFRKNP